ncbi:hypothetical protein, partial [Micromonospora sp. KC721]|uniref:hypothetical protein n=1 Tax=Micromonospora sp. KC721 TaxID=2530380 RepID=UPI001A9ED010
AGYAAMTVDNEDTVEPPANSPVPALPLVLVHRVKRQVGLPPLMWVRTVASPVAEPETCDCRRTGRRP